MELILHIRPPINLTFELAKLLTANIHGKMREYVYAVNVAVAGTINTSTDTSLVHRKNVAMTVTCYSRYRHIWQGP